MQAAGVAPAGVADTGMAGIGVALAGTTGAAGIAIMVAGMGIAAGGTGGETGFAALAPANVQLAESSCTLGSGLRQIGAGIGLFLAVPCHG
jgi:hypothetical protein